MFSKGAEERKASESREWKDSYVPLSGLSLPERYLDESLGGVCHVAGNTYLTEKCDG